MSGRQNKRGLSKDDRILWSRVARTVKPLREEAAAVETAVDSARQNKPSPLTSPATAAPYQAQPAKRPARAKGLDQPTRKKLAKGRLEIDATIDLHELSQADAHGMLLAFLHRAHASGLRHVLVITGKGASGDGILRQAVPNWLETPPFRGVVSGFDVAARHHGGAGAIYVRLRRRPGLA